MKAGKFAHVAGSGLLAIGATLVQASFVNTAWAGVPAGRQVVRFADLDLNKPADVARLYNRIRAAAESACGVDPPTGSHLLSNIQRDCIGEAIGTAVAQVHSEQLSAYQQGTKLPRAAARAGSAGKESTPGVIRSDRD